MNKKWIAGLVAALLCVAIGWGLARTFARQDEERAQVALARIEAHARMAAEAKAKTIAEIRAGAAREALEEKPLRDRAAAEEAKHNERLAAAAAFRDGPEWVSQAAMREGDWKKIEELVQSLLASGKRAPNGAFLMDRVMWGVESYFKNIEPSKDREVSERLAKYRRQFPKSAFAPILPAIQLRGAAWRARGSGYASSVTDEGRKLFAERSRAAWQEIMAVRSVSDRIPTWYEQAISIGVDAGIANEALLELADEGIERFPGNHGIYFAMLRGLSPAWGGSYADADAFIQTHVAANTNTEGESLYAGLYWQLDTYTGSDVDFFEDSRVDWPRMRSGFEALLRKYPASSNHLAFVSFACRSGDASTYLKLRAKVDKLEFEENAPQGISLEVCDTRFLSKN